MINVPDDFSNEKCAVSTFNPAFESVKYVIIVNGLNDVFQIIITVRVKKNKTLLRSLGYLTTRRFKMAINQASPQKVENYSLLISRVNY